MKLHNHLRFCASSRVRSAIDHPLAQLPAFQRAKPSRLHDFEA